jgi:fibronectin type 3 domain-containing protein
VRLEWHATAPEFRIFRKGPGDADWALTGTSAKPFFVDGSIEFGATYQYFVQSVQKTDEKYAESEPSAEISFKPVDRFPPAVPTGLTAVPGTRTIELVWERNSEKDFASYRVYRDGQKVAEGQTAPAYSDRDVKAGTRYRYQVSAVDRAGLESDLSAPVETAIP